MEFVFWKFEVWLNKYPKKNKQIALIKKINKHRHTENVRSTKLLDDGNANDTTDDNLKRFLEIEIRKRIITSVIYNKFNLTHSCSSFATNKQHNSASPFKSIFWTFSEIKLWPFNMKIPPE